MGEKDKGRSLLIDFLVVDIPLTYNIIMGRPTLNRVKTVISTYQILMQFEIEKMIGPQVASGFTSRKASSNMNALSRPRKMKK